MKLGARSETCTVGVVRPPSPTHHLSVGEGLGEGVQRMDHETTRPQDHGPQDHETTDGQTARSPVVL